MEIKEFEEQKKKQLNMKDKSNEGNWDVRILELCEKVNSKKEYYTTSSCSGRIVLVKGIPKKEKNVFLFKSHDKIEFSQLKRELEKSIKKYSDLIYLKQEPCIIHIACLDLDLAVKLLDIAKFSGWKMSGIIANRNRFVLELRSTEKLEMPIVEKKILVDDDFLNILVKEANDRLERTWGKISKLERGLDGV